MADALFTATQQRVLGLLFGQPNRSFFATEIIQLTEGGSGAVQRELLRLEQSGLVSTTRVGTQKHYRANQASPLFEELAGIIMKTVGAAEPVRHALQPFERRIAFAAIYGSTAKGTDTSSSDIDLMVVSDALKLERLFEALEPVERRLSRRINPALYTRKEFRQRLQSQEGFVGRVLAGPHIALIGSMDAAQTT